MNDDKLDRYLQSVGKECFVKYFGELFNESYSNLIAHKAQVGSTGFPGSPPSWDRGSPGSAGFQPAWTARGLEARAPGKAAAPT